MALDLFQVREAITKPKRSAAIQKAIAQQNRIKFHAETHVSQFYSQPLTEFINWIRTLIPADKAKVFTQLFRYPVKTNEIAEICFDRLSRIFDGRNPSYNYQFLSSMNRDDWEWYRQDMLNEPNVWSTTAWEFFKTEINCIQVVDLPKEQTGPLPEPYFYFLSISKVIDYDFDSKGNMSYVIFRQPGKKIAVIDDATYRVFTEGDDRNIKDLETEAAHDLKYCPASFFWQQSINLSEPDIKAHPLSRSFGALDWFLFYHHSKQHLDMYGSYPIYSGYEQSCDYADELTKRTCDGGFLKDSSGFYAHDAAGTVLKCPKCGDKRIAGVGSFIEVPVPVDKEQADLSNPVQMLTVDSGSLEFNVSEIQRLKNEIISTVVGTDSDVLGKEAVNEEQVNAGFESKTTILNRVKKGFEQAQTFIDSTVCRLRYGSDFISAKINYGTEFYELSPAQLRTEYAEAKEAGASEAELDALLNSIIETEYRTNPTQMQRMLILSELEPLRHLSRAEVLELYDKKLIDQQTLLIKIYFANFVRRFERENINILEFGTAIPFDKKISIITQKFKDYADEQGQGLASNGNNSGQLPGSEGGGGNIPPKN